MRCLGLKELHIHVQMLFLVSFAPLSPSLLVAIQRLPSTTPVTVVLPSDGDSLSSKLPRHVTLELCKSVSLWDRVATAPPTACIAVLRDPLLLLPESLGLACAVAQEQATKYVTFVDMTGKAETRGNVFSVQRHWSASPSASQSFVTTIRTLVDDADVWKETWEGSAALQWAALETLQGRVCLCPMPSLGAPLPLSDSSNPPGVQWATLQEFVNKAV